ncbi:nuclear transport factor 2 family protein [Saccharopolyspora shandongensis]|uniref:nuclear transport factor 2 family protein n=1 Tax=Saccharopolyspora shandongensis TaxID=418495 RepID=UPI0033D486A3
MTDLDVDDRFAIQQTTGRYAHAYDTGDVEGFVGVFTEDGIFEVVLVDQHDQRALFQGAAELRDFAESGMPRVNPVLHHVCGFVFDETDADEPRTRATVVVTKQYPDGPTVVTHGTYFDRWRKTEAGWRIAHRRYVALGYAGAHRTSPAKQ